jgi:hypothetical protein
MDVTFSFNYRVAIKLLKDSKLYRTFFLTDYPKMNFFFKSDDAHTSAVDDTLQYFNAALGSMDPDDDVGIGVANSGVRPKGPLRGGRKKKHKKTSR